MAEKSGGEGLLSGFLDAVAFLTRVPVAPRHGAPPNRAVPWFPLVGALVGLTTAALYAGSRELVTPLVAATLAMAGQVLLTGAFHEDGLADTADAAGGATREDRIRILDDPTHGTYGVVALVLALGLRIGAVAGLSAGAAFAVLPAAHALSRAAAVALMGVLPAASERGLAASAGRGLSRSGRDLAVLAGLAVAVALLGAWAVPAGTTAVLGAAVMAAYAKRTLGGITGDLLGATQQVVELGVLVVLLVAVGRGVALPPW
jgi:adenosylcobinamide-GDP ribazoletransferase